MHQSNSPEVVGKVGLQQILVGHGEIAFHPPGIGPRVAHDEPLVLVVVANRNDGVASHHFFTGLGHWNMAGMRHSGALKAVIHGKAEDEGISRGQTAFELGKRARNALIGSYLIFGGIRVSLRGRLIGELADVVRPVGDFRRSA